MGNESIFAKSLGYLNTTISPFLTKLIVAVIILLIGFIIARIIASIVYKLLHEFELNNALEKAGIKLNLEDIIKLFVIYLIYFIAIIWALTELGLSTIILNILFAAVIIVIIIAILLGIKDFIPNALAGLSMSKKGIIKEGDFIKFNGLEGTVKKINIVDTEVRTKKKEIIIVPNINLKKKAVLIRKKKN